ncbi:MAG: Mrp/NBP35 family ATP-binding protein [Oscillospiraceae bacterium]|nr:Mrp/NBP35 family ATP-binding protein [Oscillospiraceae bacterium]
MEENKCNAEGSSQCSGDCSSCSSAHKEQVDFTEKLNDKSHVKHVIGVVSGKGGVGKSMVAAMLAVLLNRKGYKVGIMDADITGPSIPKMFGINKRAVSTPDGVLPEETANGIKIMSINLLLDQPDAPVVWRGPVIGGAVKQFWTDVVWGDLDYMFIDMPPGTGDVPLTVYQSIPIDGVVIVTSPQDLVSLIVKKAYNMAVMMNIPVIGIVENMSYVKCPDCGIELNIFGESHISEICNELQVMVLGKMPIDPQLSSLCDDGKFERNNADYLFGAADLIESALS